MRRISIPQTSPSVPAAILVVGPDRPQLRRTSSRHSGMINLDLFIILPILVVPTSPPASEIQASDRVTKSPSLGPA